MKDIKIDEIYTFKLVTGEEMVGKVTAVDYNTHTVEISEPVSVAPGPQGMGLIPTMLTANRKNVITLNTNSVELWGNTADDVVRSYREATSAIVTPTKKVILG